MSGEGSEEFPAVCCDMLSPLRVELRGGGGGYSLVVNECKYFVVTIHYSPFRHIFLLNSDLPSRE